MLVVNLLILSISIGLIVFLIQEKDEIHQIIFFLSGLIFLICAFILSPLVIKILLVLFFFILENKLFPVLHN